MTEETVRVEGGELRRVEVRPGDVFVLNVNHNLTSEQAARLRAQWRELVGEVPLVVLPHGAELTVFRPGEADNAGDHAAHCGPARGGFRVCYCHCPECRDGRRCVCRGCRATPTCAGHQRREEGQQ